MAITESLGYEGTVDYADITRWLPYVGSGRYGVVDDGWRPSAGTGDRGLRIGPGWGWGHGVIDFNDANVNLNLASVASGQRYDMIVARRNWTTPETTFAIVTGSSAKTLPARETDPADVDEQPIALCRVVAGSAVIAEIIDLRVWRGGYARSTLALEYFNEIGTRLRIGGLVHERVLGNTYTPAWIQNRASDPEWVAIAHRTGYSNLSGVHEFGYVEVDGGVVLKGAIQKITGAIQEGGHIATLPALARPTRAVRHLVYTSVQDQVARISIATNGAVEFGSRVGVQTLPEWITVDGLFLPRNV